MNGGMQFDEETTRSSLQKPRGGLVNYLVKQGVARDSRSAAIILTWVVAVIFVVALIIFFTLGSGNEIPLTSPAET